MAADDSEVTPCAGATVPTELPLPNPGKTRTRTKIGKWWLATLLVLIAVAVFIGYQLCYPSDKIQGPIYQGKTARQWFAEAEATPGTRFLNSESYRAFVAMEGDAVPFLIATFHKNRKSRLEYWYGGLFRYLPNRVADFLPLPHSTGFYVNRKLTTLHLLGVIGMEQRFKCLNGVPWSSKISITNALPVFQAALTDSHSKLKLFAAQDCRGLGFLASPLVPELIAIAATPKHPGCVQAVQTLGIIGPAASNAVPVLIQIVANPQHTDRLYAAQALGSISAADPAAAFALAASLDDSDTEYRQVALRALAANGVTPSELLPRLRALRQDTNEWFYTYASLALWNHDRQNPELFQAVACTLPTNACGLVSTLADLGPRAAPFVPALQRKLSDTNVSVFVRRALRQITNAPMTPY